jgi:hypothetical protein
LYAGPVASLVPNNKLNLNTVSLEFGGTKIYAYKTPEEAKVLSTVALKVVLVIAAFPGAGILPTAAAVALKGLSKNLKQTIKSSSVDEGYKGLDLKVEINLIPGTVTAGANSEPPVAL